MQSTLLSTLRSAIRQRIKISTIGPKVSIHDSVEVSVGLGKIFGNTRLLHYVSSSCVPNLNVLLEPGTIVAAQSTSHLVNRRRNISVVGAVSRTFSIPSFSGPSFLAKAANRNLRNLSSDNCRKACMKLRNNEPPKKNNNSLYGFFSYHVVKRSVSPYPLLGFVMRSFHNSAPTPTSFSAGTIYMRRSFPRSNSSFFLSSGNALKSEVVPLREDIFLMDAGLGTPRICMQDELTEVPINQTTRFENKVGYLDRVSGESPIKKRTLERFFVDLVAGESVSKERASARFKKLVGPTDVVDGEPLLIIPQRFRKNRAWMKLNKIWRTNTKVKGLICRKIKGGYSVAIGGFLTLLPSRHAQKRKSFPRFTIESISPKKLVTVVVF